DEGLLHLRGKQIHTLRLSKTGITEEALEVIAELKSLSSLSIYRAPITDDGLMKLKGLSELRSLLLTDTEVSEEGLDALRMELPKLRYARTRPGIVLPRPPAKPVPKK
ncbi:MAG: hypothetical protein MI861_27970, partial [Pirellulales bacterium]|nr:hypothetical protein [Pirellulales bacterium]